MALPNIFNRSVVDVIIKRINQLTSETKPQWKKMDEAQALTHSNETNELV